MATVPLGIQIRRLFTLLAEIALTRADLARLEFAEWRGQTARAILFTIGLAISAFLTVQTLLVAILVQCWDTCRETAAWSLVGFFAVMLLICGIGLILALKASRQFLPATREVLLDDLESLKDEYDTRFPASDD